MSRCWRSVILVCVFFLLATNTQADNTFTISDIKVEGLERIDKGTVLNYLPLRVGDRFGQNQTAYAIRELFKTGFFSNITLAREGDILIVRLQERPAISKVEFSGNDAIPSEQLEKALDDIGISAGQVYNRSLLEKMEQELERVYFAQGKYGIRINTEVEELNKNLVGINIEISEGVAARIKQINIVGNTVFPEDKLLDDFQLGIPGFWNWFSSMDQYSKPAFAGDLETLRSYYQDRGFIRFDIDSTQVAITPDKKDIYITININEGEVYSIKDVKLLGDLVVPAEELRALLTVKPGDIFSRKETTESKTRINELLGDNGYAFSRVQVIPEIDEETRSVVVNYLIEPGKKVYIRRINFFGHLKTRDETLRREMRLFEGGELSTSKLNRSRIRLQRLSFIENVDVKTEPVLGSDDLVDVNISVDERLSGTFNATAGYSDADGFLFSLGLSLENLYGTGKHLGLEFNNSQTSTIYSVTFTNPYHTVDGVSRTLKAYYQERDADAQRISDFLTDTYGLSVSYGIPLTEYDTFRFGYGYENLDVKLSSNSAQEFQDYLEAHGSNYNYFTVNASIVHDTRNRTVFADRGSVQTLALDGTIPGSELEFYKLSYLSRFYYGLTDDLTLMLRGDFAVGEPYGGDDYPFFERFYAGGLSSVRGYRSRTLGPRDSGNGRPVGGDLRTIGSLELIFPVPFVEEAPRSVRLSAFYDIGNVFLRDKDGFDADELRSSAGISFVWLAPIGPLRFSWAKALDPKDFDDTETFQFSIGSNF